MTSEYPWDVRRVPNYESAPTVAIEDAARLDEPTFWRRYVLRNRPVLVKRAVVGWPAFARWSDPAYVIGKIGDVAVRASCTPRIEGFGLRTAAEDAHASQLTREALLPAQPVRDLLPRIRTSDREVLFMELRPADKGVGALADDLMIDGVRFRFLPKPPRPRFFYSGWAAMFYKNSYSDWHYHPGADAMMCQVLGTKDTLLLPPTQEAWDAIVPIHQRQWKVYDVDVATAPRYAQIHPYHVIVEPGDGLFLPLNWWHAVQARPSEFGVTVPITWDSPYRDLRQPAARLFLRRLWHRRRRLGLAELLASSYGTLASGVRRQWRQAPRPA
jgi:hypothetical protein